jgi:tripartite ATP-independent transporter DctM subunit
MSATFVIVILTSLLIVLLALGQHICFALATVGFVGLFFLLGGRAPISSGLIMWHTAADFVLVAVPMFIFMGEILMNVGLAKRLYAALGPLLGRLPGGLLMSNIGSCALFAAISGSSLATAATIGTVAIPTMEERGYDRGMIVGSLAGGGTLGILIPPSIVMIIYGALASESVGRLFMGGVIPGLISAGFFMLYIMIRVRLKPRLAPREETAITIVGLRRLLTDVLPLLGLMFLVLGSIYLGVATPTEAAAWGAAGAICLGLGYRKLTWRMVKEGALSAVQTTSMILLIMIGASLVSYVLANLAVPRQLAAAVLSLGIGKLWVLTLLCLLYLVLGCFLDGSSIMILTLPVIMPLMRSLGFDGVWFGVVLTILLEIALLTPPVGMNLYVLQKISKADFPQLVRATIPYWIIDLGVIALLTACPALVLWLPGKMIG